MNLDLTGGSPDNRKTSVIPINYNGNELPLISPKLGMFHTSMSSPVLTYKSRVLTYGVDYRYVNKSKEIRDKYNISAHGAILLLKRGLTGTLLLEASFLGDTYELHNTEYFSEVADPEHLRDLYDPSDLIDTPKNLPPRARLLDIENVSTGLNSSMQVIYTLGMHLRDYENDHDHPSTGSWWPSLYITDLGPPIETTAEIVVHNLRGSSIDVVNTAKPRMGMISLGSIPLGYQGYEVVEEEIQVFYARSDIDAIADYIPLDLAVAAIET